MKNLNKILTVIISNLLMLNSLQILALNRDGEATTINTITEALAETSLTKLRYPTYESVHKKLEKINRISNISERRRALDQLVRHLRKDDRKRAHQEPPRMPQNDKFLREISLRKATIIVQSAPNNHHARTLHQRCLYMPPILILK